MSYPHSDFLIKRYTEDDGDELFIYNTPVREDEEPYLTLTLSCPHGDSGVKTSTVCIPVDTLEEFLDDLTDERDGEDTEDEESDSE